MEQVAELHDAFASCMTELPENLMHDIAYYFEGVCAETAAESFLELLAAKLGEVLYLLEEEYDRVEETFSVSDWEYLKNVVSDFALDIDQQKLTYIMRQITSRRIIGR